MDKSISEQILDKLKDTNLIEYFDQTATLPPPENAILLKLIKEYQILLFLK